MVRDEVKGDDDLLIQMSHLDLYEGERFNCPNNGALGLSWRRNGVRFASTFYDLQRSSAGEQCYENS